MGWVVSVTPRPCFYPQETTPGTHWTGGWVGPRAGLDTEDRGKILFPCRETNPGRPVIQPVVRHCTAWANPAPVLIEYQRQICWLFVLGKNASAFWLIFLYNCHSVSVWLCTQFCVCVAVYSVLCLCGCVLSSVSVWLCTQFCVSVAVYSV
jgi:hypothetical protein